MPAPTLQYEVAQIGDSEVAVEAINYDGDGECYVARFSGPQAYERAEEFAAWKNAGGGIYPQLTPPPR